MTFDTTTRPDLVDDGVFEPGKKTRAAGSRRPWTALTGNDLAAPSPSEDETLYDVRGRVTGDESKAAAKEVARGDKTYHFAKVGTFGSVQGALLDPKGVYFDPTDLVRDVRTTGRAKYEYRELPEAAFADYVAYLQKRTTGLLRKAERALIDG